MPEHGVRSPYSTCPFQVRVHGHDGTALSAATAFFFETDGEWFVITNWHVVTGRHFLSRKPPPGPFSEPFSLTAKLSSYAVGDRESGTFGIVPQHVPLYRGEDPVWFEHPQLGALCDVVAIPMGRPASCPDSMHRAANRIGGANIPVEPGSAVFVIGFPHALSVGFGLPLWKSGYVASEPHYDVSLGGKLSDYGGLEGGVRIPAFFIDSQTRAGMSESPVFVRYHGAWDTRDPYRKVDPDEPGFWERDDVMLWGSQGTQFVGCYEVVCEGGRAGANENEAALGLCWRADVIEVVCRGRKSGKNPHITAR